MREAEEDTPCDVADNPGYIRPVKSPRRSRLSVLLTITLLVLQGLVGGAVTLAEAGEPLTAASHIEAQHEPGCPVLHDVQRCALCHYAGTRVVVQQTFTPGFSETEHRSAATAHAVPAVTAGVRSTVQSRAPPPFLS